MVVQLKNDDGDWRGINNGGGGCAQKGEKII